MSEENQTIDPKRFYDYLVEEVKKRGIPELSFDYKTDYLVTKPGGMLGGHESEEVPTLLIMDKYHEAKVVVYNYAGAYSVQVGTSFNDKFGKALGKYETSMDMHLVEPMEARYALFKKAISHCVSVAQDKYFAEESGDATIAPVYD